MGLGVTIAVGNVPDPELANAAAVVVEERLGETTRYAIRYPVDIRDGEPTWVSDGRLDPGTELTISVAAGGALECLVKGPVHGHRIQLKHGGAGSSLEVRGSDSTVKMDRESKAEVWNGVTDADAVTTIVARYGLIPDVESTAGRHVEQKHALVQRATDLRFVRRLARRNGFLFWVSATPEGVETAHFRPPAVDGTPVATVNINRDPPGTLQLDLEWDVERPTAVEAKQLDLNSKTELDGGTDASPLPALAALPFAEIAGSGRVLHLPAPADDAGDLRARAEGVLVEAGWFLRARLETSVETLGRVVRPGALLEVAGAGTRHSGKYLVAAVAHVVDDVAHRMTIDLIRNAWGGTSGAGSPRGIL